MPDTDLGKFVMKNKTFLFIGCLLMTACGMKESKVSENNDEPITEEVQDSESAATEYTYTGESHTPEGISRNTIMQLDNLRSQIGKLELYIDCESEGISKAKYNQVMSQAKELAEEMLDYINTAKHELSDLRDKTTDPDDLDFYNQEEQRLDPYIEIVDKYLP